MQGNVKRRRWDGKERRMHIEPGLVDGAKIVLSYVTAAGGLPPEKWSSLK